MEPKNVFIGIAVVLVVVTAFTFALGELGTNYDVTDVGSSFNNTMNSVQILENLTGVSNEISGTLETEEGSGITDVDANILTRSLRSFRVLQRLVGLTSDLFYDGGKILGIPSIYLNLAAYTFSFVFGLVLIYILVIGARRLFG